MVGVARGLAALAIMLAAQAAIAQPADLPQAAPKQATAELRIYSAMRQKAVWSGAGAGAITADLCVTSTTGRFRLQITSQSGGVMTGPGKLAYSLHFHDGSGRDQVERVAQQAMISFEGSAPGAATCDAGPNATLAIETAEGDMLGQAAGEYFDRLMLAVTPL